MDFLSPKYVWPNMVTVAGLSIDVSLRHVVSALAEGEKATLLTLDKAFKFQLHKDG